MKMKNITLQPLKRKWTGPFGMNGLMNNIYGYTVPFAHFLGRQDVETKMNTVRSETVKVFSI